MRVCTFCSWRAMRLPKQSPNLSSMLSIEQPNKAVVAAAAPESWMYIISSSPSSLCRVYTPAVTFACACLRRPTGCRVSLRLASRVSVQKRVTIQETQQACTVFSRVARRALTHNIQIRNKCHSLWHSISMIGPPPSSHHFLVCASCAKPKTFTTLTHGMTWCERVSGGFFVEVAVLMAFVRKMCEFCARIHKHAFCTWVHSLSLFFSVFGGCTFQL